MTADQFEALSHLLTAGLLVVSFALGYLGGYAQ